MKLTLTINMDSRAFQDGADGRLEVARIFKGLAKDLQDGYLRASLYDTLVDGDGHAIGYIAFSEKGKAA